MDLKVFKFLLSLSFSFLLFLDSTTAQGLQFGFYNTTCPNVEIIVRNEIISVLAVAPSLSGPLLRLQFHDCFVRGCDASVLLNTTNATTPAEKDSIPNQTLRGYQIIDRVKAKLEAACPGVVSCADITALVARDVVNLTKGPHWNVLTGRRDGRVSNATEANFGLPPPFANITQLINAFSVLGLSVKDLVVLSGGHTIGISHCSSFSNRIYNFTGQGTSTDTDPTLDTNYVPPLRSKCRPNDATTIVELDPGSFKTFDVGYYKLLSKRRGLLQSDAALLNDTQTRAYVLRQANASSTEFFTDFSESMVKMGNIGVLTGTQGEIRRHCAVVN